MLVFGNVLWHTVNLLGISATGFYFITFCTSLTKDVTGQWTVPVLMGPEVYEPRAASTVSKSWKSRKLICLLFSYVILFNYIESDYHIILKTAHDVLTEIYSVA